MTTNEESEQMRKDEIFALCEIFSDSCRKEAEDENVITFDIQEDEFNDKKIEFQVRFIDSYPTTTRPDYIIHADWLPNSLIYDLKVKLNEVWEDNLNQSVVYLWIETIREFVLKSLANKSGNQEEGSNQENEYLDGVDKSFNELNMSNKSHKEITEKDDIFEFHHGQPLVVKKSVFQAHLLKIDDESKIPLARKQLMDYKSVASATHNIMAYRIIKNIDNRTIEHSNYDDDGETQAGGRLHLLLQLTDSKNVLIVVSRYFGGIKLGPDRFKYINEVAKISLQEHGVIVPKEGKQQKGKKKK